MSSLEELTALEDHGEFIRRHSMPTSIASGDWKNSSRVASLIAVS